MNEFLQILNDAEKEHNDPDPKTEKEKQLQPCDTACDTAWTAVLTNAFYLYYPGPDGNYKEPEFLRPLYVMLNTLHQAGAGLVRAKKSDGSEHYKLVQGTMPADKWESVKKRLAGDKDQLMWLFTLSVMGVVSEEEMLRQREIEAELFEETAKRLEGKDKTLMEEAARQLRWELSERTR